MSDEKVIVLIARGGKAMPLKVALGLRSYLQICG